MADAWKTTPFVAIILLAGLAQIPGALHGQARVDGASLWRRFTAITLPLLRPVITVAVLLRLIEALRVFDVIYVLTGGGPGGATTSLSLLAILALSMFPPVSLLGALFRGLAAPGVLSTLLLAFIFAFNEFLLALMLTTDHAARVLPVVVLTLVWQRRMVQGLTPGAVKE